MRRLLRRLGIYAVALWAAVTINFFLPRLAPGNPAETEYNRLASLGPVSPNLLKTLEVQFGLNTSDPLWLQYLKYLGNLLHGDLGISTTFYPASVGDVIGQNIRWTLGAADDQRAAQLHHRHADRHRAGVAARLVPR